MLGLPPFWIAAATLAAWPHPTPTGWRVTLRRVLAGLCALSAAAGLGAVAAHVRTLQVAQPAFAAGEEPLAVQGWVVANDASDNGPRLRLLVRDIEGVAQAPRYVRMSVSDAGVLTPAAARVATATRSAVGPTEGGSYDFRTRLFELGATGFAFACAGR